MNIKHDRSYISDLDKIAIEEGVAKEYLQYIFIDYDRNLITKEVAQEKNKMLMDILGKRFKIYQYNTEDEDYDIFFWCNREDMSYIQLTRLTSKAREVLCSVFENLEGYGLKVRYQYGVDYDVCQLYSIADKFYEDNKNKSFELNRGTFKIKKLDVPYTYNGNQQKRFFIMEKRKRKYGRYADDKNMYAFSKGIYNYGLFD